MADYVKLILDQDARIRELEAALREVQIALASDDVEYDDLREVDRIIHKALAPKDSALDRELENGCPKNLSIGSAPSDGGEHG